MRKKTIAMLLCAVLATQPVSMVYATKTEQTGTQEETNVIKLTKENNKPVIYDKDGLKIFVQQTLYNPNGNNPLYRVEFMVENETQTEVSLSMYDSYVDGFKVGTSTGSSSIAAGKKGIVDFSIWEKDYKPYEIEDFQIWESTLTIKENGQEISAYAFNAEKDIFVDKDGNTPVTESNAESNSSDEDKSQLQEQFDILTAENTELKEKVSSLEAENEELKETNKKLKSSNKKLKKENEELKAAQNETVPEESPSAEPEPTEAPQEPVTEYKDATTIRIVQQALNEAGYNCGTPDGISGGKTSQAITSYQTAKGITVNGLITDELLESMGIAEKVQEAIKAEGAKNEYDPNYSYDQLARNPDTYIGKKIKIRGKVLQAETSDDICYARVAMNSSYDTVIFVTYDKDILGYRLLEDDMITVYGTSLGVYSYEAVSGATITIPWLQASIIEM